GVVESFDAHRGLGYINAQGERFLFHCAEIADGTRDIAVNTQVSFVPVERFGIREASVVTVQTAESS
ncbi:MAG: cold shock domain-containing protein, partial [Actinomycetota bacterium]